MQDSAGLAEEAAKAERKLKSVQSEEDRAIRLYVSGKITETQLDLQRKFFTERLESLQAKLDDYRAREASGAQKLALMATVLAWAGEVGEGLDDLTPEQRKDVLQMVVDEIVIDRENNVNVTLAIPVEDESVAIASYPSPCKEGNRGKAAPATGGVSADFSKVSDLSVFHGDLLLLVRSMPH